MHITDKRLQSKLKTKHIPGNARIYETNFNSFCAARAAVLFKAIENHLWTLLRRAFVEIGTYCGGEFHGPSGLFHYYLSNKI